MDRLFALLDRAGTLAPLALLAYFLKRHADDREQLIRSLELERESARNDRRELITRITHPNLVPTGTQPLAPPAMPDATRSADARRRAAAMVGRAAAPTPPPNFPSTNGTPE